MISASSLVIDHHSQFTAVSTGCNWRRHGSDISKKAEKEELADHRSALVDLFRQALLLLGRRAERNEP